MELNVNDQIIKTHKRYTEFDQQQYLIVDIQPGEKITVIGNNALGTEVIREVFIGQYSNCHANIWFQDKGVKSP